MFILTIAFRKERLLDSTAAHTERKYGDTQIGQGEQFLTPDYESRGGGGRRRKGMTQLKILLFQISSRHFSHAYSMSIHEYKIKLEL